MTPRRAAPLRLGILGAARIARGFVAGVAGSPAVAVTAIASREVARARAFVRDTGTALVVHASYDALLADDDVDAVYVPLPNGLHGAWSIRAMEAGKHVLCEKPLAATVTEAMAMYDTARACGVRLVEAYPYRSQPQTLRLQELLAEGAIGRVQLVQASFGFPLVDRTDIRFDAELAGGALMDLGSYPLSLIRMISGAAPVAMQALGHWDALDVDRAAIVSLQFADGMLAQAACSFETAVHRQALIAGDAGSIETTFANHSDLGPPPVIRIRRGTGRRDAWEEIEVARMNGFRAEAEAFAGYVRGAEWNGISEAESLDVAAMLDGLRALVATERGGT
ncbi:MAG: Gfo/Idh/MocA family oxidoreductase [Gemmatimonadaceae bacterium]|nr:Gfo/Idh/MocA family oxidoreductase [Gemmatimonadaceae bacterium]